MRRGLVMQGVLFQGGLAVLLVFMALLSRNDERSLAMYLWSLIIPAGVVFAFVRAYQRTERLPADDAKEGEAREGKAAMGLLGFVFIVWLAGIAAIFWLIQ